MIIKIDVPEYLEEQFKNDIERQHEDYKVVRLIDLLRTLDFGTKCEIVDSVPVIVPFKYFCEVDCVRGPNYWRDCHKDEKGSVLLYKEANKNGN